MKIYYLMFAYVFCVGLLYKMILAYNGISISNNKKYPLVVCIISMLLPVFYIGLRTGFADTQAYITGYNDLSLNFKEIEKIMLNSRGALFVLYEWVIKRYVSENANVFLMITAIIQALCVIKLYRKYSIDYSLSIMLFFLSCMFFYMTNGMRQFLALCIVLFFADFIFEKKYIRFVIIVLIASFIHVSVLIWIPAIFIVQGKPFNLRVIIMIILIGLAVFYVDGFTDLLEDSLTGTAYEGLTEQFASDNGSNIMHTLIAGVPVAIALMGRKIIEYRNDKKLDVLINIAVFGMAISLLANFTSGILVGRMPINFTIFNYILFPILISTVFERKSARLVTALCYLGYMLYMMYYFSVQNVYYVSSVLGIDTRL